MWRKMAFTILVMIGWRFIPIHPTWRELSRKEVIR